TTSEKIATLNATVTSLAPTIEATTGEKIATLNATVTSLAPTIETTMSEVVTVAPETGCAIDAAFLSTVTNKRVVFSLRQAEIYSAFDLNPFAGLPEDVIPIEEYLSNGTDIIQINAAFESNSILHLIVDDGKDVGCSLVSGFCVRAACCNGTSVSGSHLCGQSPLVVCCLGNMETTPSYCTQGQAVVTYEYSFDGWVYQDWRRLEDVFGSSVNGYHIQMAC
ncbi:unnamed protein product, partial [Owenia fusiformis]